MEKIYCCVIDQSTKKIIAANIEVAAKFILRLRGLLGRKTLSPGEGMLLWPCHSIHCFGMRFSIDVVFLDHQYRVTNIKNNLTPLSMASDKQAKGVLELVAGEIKKHGIKVGDQFIICFEGNPDYHGEFPEKEKCGHGRPHSNLSV